MPFFPNYILRDVLAWYVVLAVLAALAAFYPWELGKKADPFAVVPPGIRPEWYFLAMFHTLKLLPSHVLGFEGEQLGVDRRSASSRCSWCSCRSSIDARAAASAARCSPCSRVLGLVYLVVVHDHRALREVGAVMLADHRRCRRRSSLALLAPARAAAQPRAGRQQRASRATRR